MKSKWYSFDTNCNFLSVLTS